jgi:ATP-binding cassette subfamily B protein
VRTADRILVLEQGKLVETGDHAGLIAKGGLYSRLSALQFQTPEALH